MKAALHRAKVCKKPIARYDMDTKRAYIEYPNGERKYIVDTKKEILETDWSNLEGTSDNRLTLITCIKNKVNQRLCVQAVQENI